MNCRILIPSTQKLQIPDIKREFVGFLSDLNQEVTLDSIDLLEEKKSFRIRSHNVYGVLPDIIVPETGNRYEVLDRLDTEIARLVDTAHINIRSGATTPAAPVSAVANVITTLVGKRGLHRKTA
jgi:hypothetical protein